MQMQKYAITHQPPTIINTIFHGIQLELLTNKQLEIITVTPPVINSPKNTSAKN